MLIYIIAVTVAALIQIGTIYLLRGDFFRNFLYTVPLILVFQFLFLWSYANAPKFITIWFITTAITGVLSFLFGYFIWKEQASVYNIIGIAFVIMGIMLLRLK